MMLTGPLLDWIQDSIIERNRRQRAARKRQTPYHGPRGELSLAWIWSQLQNIAHAGQSWFVVSVVGEFATASLLSSADGLRRLLCIAQPAGLAIGVNAAVISIATEWLSDIKMGYCSDGWWLNQQFCCWEIEGGDEDTCEAWHQWSNAMPARWAIYVLFAVRNMFAGWLGMRWAASYVQTFHRLRSLSLQRT